jgi:hypothetical protein
MKGYQFEDREFLVFYFDTKEDYEVVRKRFEIPTRHPVSHPELDTAKLVRMVQQFIEKGGESEVEKNENGSDSSKE